MVKVKQPKVSVVMSLYNSERYLKEAIDSVLAQTLDDFEFIIIDDGSTDHSADIVLEYCDQRIQLIRQSNAGLPAALNIAITHAKAPLIARMDPDDVCLAERLQKQFDYLQAHPDIILVGSAAMCIDAQGEQIGSIQKQAYYSKGRLTLPESPCIHPSVMFRKAACETLGFYPEEMRFGGEDAVFFNKILATIGAIANLEEILLMYRVTATSMSQKSKRFNRLLRERVVKEVQGETISVDEKEALAKAYAMPRGGYFGYHLYVGKLLLKNKCQNKKARIHFATALKENIFSLHAWLGWIGSFFPRAWLQALAFSDGYDDKK